MTHIAEMKPKKVGKCIVCGEMIYESYEHGTRPWVEKEKGPVHKKCLDKLKE